MAYPTLEKLFYADNSSDRFAAHELRAQARLEEESTFRTGIETATGELFLAVPRDLSIMTEQILRRERRVSALWAQLPPVALGAFIRSLIMDEVVYSNEIEGVHSTRRQIEIALDKARRSASKKPRKATDEHTPFLEFARLYLDLTESPSVPSSLEDIRSIYDSVVAGSVDPSDLPESSLFRVSPVYIENERGAVVHTGVMPESAIEDMLRQWIELSKSEDIPELYSSLLCHFLFGYIHPFYDGNGRTGRYLLALHLSRPLSNATILSLSRSIAENKAKYYRAFDITEKPRNCAEGTHFVLAMLELISQAQEGLIADLSSKQESLLNLSERIDVLSPELSGRECEVLFYAAQMHLYDVLHEVHLDRLAEHLGVSKPTARKAIAELSDAHGLFKKVSARPPTYRLTGKALERLGLV